MPKRRRKKKQPPLTVGKRLRLARLVYRGSDLRGARLSIHEAKQLLEELFRLDRHHTYAANLEAQQRHQAIHSRAKPDGSPYTLRGQSGAPLFNPATGQTIAQPIPARPVGATVRPKF